MRRFGSTPTANPAPLVDRPIFVRSSKERHACYLACASHQANVLAVGVYNADTQARLAASPRNPSAWPRRPRKLLTAQIGKNLKPLPGPKAYQPPRPIKDFVKKRLRKSAFGVSLTGLRTGRIISFARRGKCLLTTNRVMPGCFLNVRKVLKRKVNVRYAGQE